MSGQPVGPVGGAGPAVGGGGATGGATAGTAGAGGAPGVGKTYAPSFKAIYSEIFADGTYACNLGPCHGGTSFQVADPTTAYMNLMSAVASGAACASSGKKLIVPGNPAESLLLSKVKDAPPCGERMRITGPYLNAREIKQITDWIQMGASND